MENTENEKKKELLMSYQRNKSNVIRLEEQLLELQLNKMSFAMCHNGDYKETGNINISEYAAKVDETEQELMAARYNKICAFQDIQRGIELIEDEKEKDILTYRYLRGLKWEDVAARMGYCWKHVHRIHNRALKNFKMI